MTTEKENVLNGDLTTKAGEVKPCTLWGGVRDKRGYGVLTISGVNVRAHRVSYRLHVGKIPRGMYVCHRCDNPPCFEPSHLFAGTASENQRDSVAKKRHWESRKTHCPKGHSYRIETGGRRKCRTCDNSRRRIAYGADTFKGFFAAVSK